MLTYLFYLQREPVIPRHFYMLRNLQEQLQKDGRFSSVKYRLDGIDLISPSKKNIVNAWCKRNKLSLELVICTLGKSFNNKVDFVLGYGLGKYFKNFLTNLDIPYLDLADPNIKDEYCKYTETQSAADNLYAWFYLENQKHKDTYLIPQFNNNLFDYVEKSYV